VGYVVYGAFKYQGDGSTGGGSKTVKKGCFADGGSGDDGKKDGNKRAIPEMVSSGKGCGAAGIAACEQAAIAKGYNTFGVQWPQGSCQCFIGNNAKYDEFGKSTKCNDKGEGGVWANEVYVIEEGENRVGKKATFNEMIETNYAVAQIVGGKMDVKCDNNMFGDPLPDTKKGCYCDDVGVLTEAKIISDQQYFANQWQVEQDRQLAEALQLQMEQEAAYNAQRLAEIAAYEAEMTAQFEAEQAADAAWAEQQYQEYKAWMIAEMDAQQAADKQADEYNHQLDLENQRAAQQAEVDRVKAEAAAKVAEQAGALDKVKLEIEAERAKAAWAKAEQKRKMAEVANRERAAAKAAKKEAQAARERKKKLKMKMRIAKKEQARKAKEAAEKAKLESERELQEAEARRAATEGARAQEAIDTAVANALANNAQLEEAKAAEDARLQAIQDQKDREEEAAIMQAKEAEL
jgi:hypothetical protein